MFISKQLVNHLLIAKVYKLILKDKLFNKYREIEKY